MCSKALIVISLAIFFMGAGTVKSQAPEALPVEALQAVKKTNADLIEKQQKSLEALDKLEETAKQLKIFGKRA